MVAVPVPLTFSIDVATLGYKKLREKTSKKKLNEYSNKLKNYLKVESGEGAALFTTYPGNGGLYGDSGALYESVGIPLHELGETILGNTYDNSFMPYVQAGLVGLMGITAGLCYKDIKTSQKALGILDELDENFETDEGKEIVSNFVENMKDQNYKKSVLKKVGKLTENPNLETEIIEYLQETEKTNFKESVMKYLPSFLNKKEKQVAENYLQIKPDKEEYPDSDDLYDSVDELNQTKKSGNEVTVVISTHKHELNIEKTIRNVLSQNYNLKNIYISDSDLPQDHARDVINKLSEEFPDVHYWSKSGVISKGKKINELVRDPEVDLGDYVYFMDGDVELFLDTIEKMVEGFTEDNIAAVTSYGYVTKPETKLAEYFYYGKEWTNRLSKFRKVAQEYRRAMPTVCGASFMVKSDVLQEIELPTNSQTEDAAYTWRLQEEGYKVGFAPEAEVTAEDVPTLKDQLKQTYRWNKGTWQNIWNHKKIFAPRSKGNSLAYSTVAPGVVESLLYAGTVVSLPVIACFDPDLAKYFLIGDTLLSFATPAVFPALSGESKKIPKELAHTLKHYHHITAYKALSSALWLGSGAKVSFDILTGKTGKWKNEW